MASDNQLKGFRQTYQETGKPGYGGGNGVTDIDPGRRTPGDWLPLVSELSI